MAKRDQQIAKRDKRIKTLTEEIERRQFVEAKVQRYVKGLIGQNRRQTEFMEGLRRGNATMAEVKR